MTEAKMGTRQSPAKLSKDEIAQLHAAMRNVNLSEGQSMQVFRYANRVPLQFQPAACAITQSVIGNNWRSYGLSQSRGNLPQGPVTVMVHMASVWVPFTSESKEAIASYPEIQKELRLALQAVGRKLGMYLNRRQKVKQEGERRSIFLRYLGEVSDALRGSPSDAPATFKKLQTRLGDIHDAHVLGSWLGAQSMSAARLGKQALAAEARRLADAFEAEAREHHQALLASEPRLQIERGLEALGRMRSQIA
jgi:hypothetical protein